MSNIKRIGENVRLYRHRAGLSQEQLALQSGTNVSYLGQIERGEKNPTVKTLEKIASALGISLNELIVTSDGEKGESNQQIIAVFTQDDIKRYLRDLLNDKDNHIKY